MTMSTAASSSFASGIGGTPIALWQRNGQLNDMLLRTLKGLPPGYKVTQVLWQQGESDFLLATPPADYVASFRSLVDVLAENGVDAPLYISISTKCGPWTANNPIAAAQRSLIDGRRVFLGVDSDGLLGTKDRYRRLSLVGKRAAQDGGCLCRGDQAIAAPAVAGGYCAFCHRLRRRNADNAVCSASTSGRRRSHDAEKQTADPRVSVGDPAAIAGSAGGSA